MGSVVNDTVAVASGNQFIEHADVALAESARLRRPRGWLMRRLLLAADLIGLTVAFVIALTLAPIAATDTVSVKWELLLFLSALPLWVLLARLHGLYDRDEGRSDHSTVDDVVGIIQVVTLGTWGFLAITYLAGLPHPTLDRLVQFWLLAIVLVPLAARRGADASPAGTPPTSRTSSSSVRVVSRACSRARCSATPSTA